MSEILRKLYYKLYYMFFQRPTSDQINDKLIEIEKNISRSFDKNDDRCDCLVTAGGKIIDCKKNILKAACKALGDQDQTIDVTVLPVGGCALQPNR